MVDSLDAFLAALRDVAPGINAQVDAAADPAGESFIDVDDGDFGTEISYRPDVGFGIYVSERAFGQRPDEIYRSAAKAARRVAQLRESFAKDGLIAHLTLSEMRELIGLTQAKMAETLAIKQPSVQRTENRANVEVMTLARHIRALGGRLELSVVFEDMEARLELSQLGDRRR